MRVSESGGVCVPGLSLAARRRRRRLALTRSLDSFPLTTCGKTGRGLVLARYATQLTNRLRPRCTVARGLSLQRDFFKFG
jgi:hypothetical protein